MDDAMRILIRCDATPEIGFGHVVRCLALANTMCEHHSWQVGFAMMKGEAGFTQVQAKGYAVHRAPSESLSGEEEGSWLQQVVESTRPHALVLDVRTDLTTSAIQSIRESGVLIVTIDDPSGRRLAADMAFYPPVPQVEKMDWTGFTGKRYVGWEWVLLRPEFAQAREKKLLELPRSENCPPRILVTMGGSDPAGLTLMALKAIEKLDGEFRVLVIVGGGFMHEASLGYWLATANRTYEICRDVTDMASLMVETDLAVVSFGMTAYELAVVGVPTLYLCLTDDHSVSATAFVMEGFGVSLGSYDKVSIEMLSENIADISTTRDRTAAINEREGIFLMV